MKNLYLPTMLYLSTQRFFGLHVILSAAKNLYLPTIAFFAA